MDKFIDALLQLIPFSVWFEKLGLGKELSAALSVVFAALLLWALSSLIKSLIERQKNLRTAKDLKPQFDYQMVRHATRIYIPTQGQNASPARQDEPGFTHQFVLRKPLIPFFIKTAFNEKTKGEKFYIILADSGMGKTTFLINLFIRYHSFFNFRRHKKMRLMRFSHPDTLSEIKAIKKEDVKDTILLLDALDEDPHIVSKDPNVSDEEAFSRRVDEIIEATRNFSDVVMTCRTQYFPGQESDTIELKVQRPDQKGFYVLNKFYLSPFTDEEVRKYLNKKFGYLSLWNRAKKKRAARVISQSRQLVMRPMMLSYINYLVEENREYKSEYEVYETLIEKWLIREAEKRKYLADRPAFIRNLEQVSQQTAIEIFSKWQEENRMYLSKEEAVAIAARNHFDLKHEEVTGQSLLTCDGAGNWKFAHKSIMEFFLAKEALKNPNSFKDFDFSGMDMARRFFESRIPENFVFVEGGMLTKRGSRNPVLVESFWICKYPFTQAEYVKVTGKKNPSHFKEKGKNPIESVSWMDAIEVCNILNLNRGYPAAYDVSGNLLDASGMMTDDVAKVRGFRLPTEAEWEYAARGGNQSKGYEYSGRNDIIEVAWHDKNSGGKTHPVGKLKPNELGLYDMSGNVFEWCNDWSGDNITGKEGEKTTGLSSDSKRAMRGGSWDLAAQFSRISHSDCMDPRSSGNFTGFRLVFVP